MNEPILRRTTHWYRLAFTGVCVTAIGLLQLIVLVPHRSLAATCPATVLYTFDVPGDPGADSSGNGFNASVVRAIAPGFSGSALYAIGTDATVDFQALVPPLDNHTGDLTGFAWVRPEPPHTGDNMPPNCIEGTIFRKGDNFWPQIQQNNEGLRYQNESSGQFLVDGNPEFGICSTNWSHVAFTRSGSTIRLYHNGVEVGVGNLSGPAAPVANSEPLTLGSIVDPDRCEFNGLIDQVSIHPCAFSAAEVMAQFAGESTDPGLIYCCAAPPENMVGWWKLESAGPTIQDELGRHHGAPDQNPSSIIGVVDNALSFSASGSRVIVPNDPELDFDTGDITIDAWVKTDSVATIARMPSGPGAGILFDIVLVVGPDPTLLLDFNGTVASGPVPVDEWTHAAVVLDRASTELRFYLDGQRTDTRSAAGVGSLSSNGDLFLGEMADGLDEVEIFDRALTDAEILAIYRGGTDGKCPFIATPTQSRPGRIAMLAVLLAVGSAAVLGRHGRLELRSRLLGW